MVDLVTRKLFETREKPHSHTANDATAKSQEIVLSDLVPIDRMGNQVALPQVGMPGASEGRFVHRLGNLTGENDDQLLFFLLHFRQTNIDSPVEWYAIVVIRRFHQ